MCSTEYSKSYRLFKTSVDDQKRLVTISTKLLILQLLFRKELVFKFFYILGIYLLTPFQHNFMALKLFTVSLH